MNAQLRPDEHRELLIGCGNSRDKRISWPDVPKEWAQLTTLDMSAAAKPDIVHNLNDLPYPFGSNEFDEIHAYAVLEHCGRQGDGEYFFAQFAEFWRILKPGGFFCFTVPMWDHPLAWGCPDHTRCMPKDLFLVLDHHYYDELGMPGRDKADYRELLGATNFTVFDFKEGAEQLAMVLRAVK